MQPLMTRPSENMEKFSDGLIILSGSNCNSFEYFLKAV
ncbi:hypothetical protein l13_02570 [Neisseria weaveri ATCC 51223]|nr:hypothetical protein l13_02570 [Neisseria weaveri ATCC 51223]